MRYVCSTCGGADIYEKVWVNPNTREVVKTCDYWCQHCSAFVDVKYLTNKDKTQ